MLAPGPDRPVPKWLAAGLCGLYWVMAVLLGGQVPFVERTMFAFPVLSSPLAAPLFRVDGELADVTAYTDFRGIGPRAIDVDHIGYRSTVEHHFHEMRAWIAAHPSPPETVSGGHPFEVGLLIFDWDLDGRVTTTVRVDGTGWAHRRDE